MKIPILVITVSLALLLTSYNTISSQGQIEYSIDVESDGSATWTITQVAELNASLDSWDAFQNRVAVLVETAENITAREMIAEVESMAFTPSGSYVVVEYRFRWENFSKIEVSKIIVGDVFQVEDFFLQLYGDGEIQMIYPPEYTVETVSPLPYERDDSHQILGWLGTNDFTNGLPSIVFRQTSVNPGFLEFLQQNAVLTVSLIVAASGSSIGSYLFFRRKKKIKETIEIPKLPGLLTVESDEEKIVKILRSSGGSLFQSAIVDECKFSKAKTSQLLALLESKGVVNRHKRGRDKIVNLVEK